jgi:hypothetical protein
MTHRVFDMAVADVYPHYIDKVVKKGRTEAELEEVTKWLTGFDGPAVKKMLEARTTFRDFFSQAALNPKAELITGSICGVKIQEIEDPLMKKIRYWDKVVDELAKGRSIEKVMRS